MCLIIFGNYWKLIRNPILSSKSKQCLVWMGLQFQYAVTKLLSKNLEICKVYRSIYLSSWLTLINLKICHACTFYLFIYRLWVWQKQFFPQNALTSLPSHWRNNHCHTEMLASVVEQFKLIFFSQELVWRSLSEYGPYIAYFDFKARLISGQTKHQLDATLCRFYFCRVTLHVSGASAIIRSI